MRTFYTLAITQAFSKIGSRMTGIALGIWIFQDTGNTTPVLLASFFAMLPSALAGAFAGVIADRLPRRLVIIFTDVGQAFGTLALVVSFFSGSFQYWHLYAVMLWQGVFQMLQDAADDASVTMLVPDRHRDRANAVRFITGPVAGMVAPVAAGFAYALVGLTGVMLFDLGTFAVAVAVVSLLRIPDPKRSEESRSVSGSLFREVTGTIRFLRGWGILPLLIYAAVLNFLLSGPLNLTTPYVLSRTGSESALGVLLGVMNVGLLAGGVLMMVFGGTRPRMHGIMVGLLFRSACVAVYGMARTPIALGVAVFLVLFANPLIDASLASLLQAKVPADMHGRVFALLGQVTHLTDPLSVVAAGPLVDRVLTPAVGGQAWDGVAWLVGSGPGAGMGLLLVTCGVLMFAATALVYSVRGIRTIEASIPDQAVAD